MTTTTTPSAILADAAAPASACSSAPWRTTVAMAAMAYQAAAGAALACWLVAGQRSSLFEAAAACALPLLLAAWLAWRADPDDRQFVVKLFAAAMFGPALLAFWAGSAPSATGAAVWPFMVPATLLHGAALVAAVVWLGAYVTRVAPAPGVAAVDAAMLRERLASLVAAGVPADLDPAPAHGITGQPLVFHLLLPDAVRSHRVTLHLDSALSCVRVLERTSSVGARPANPSETSLRGPGDAAYDPTRPDAQRVSGIVWQTTMVVPERLAALQPAFFGNRAMLAPAEVQVLDAEGVVTLMCAVVTRSGWTWQPGWRA